MPSLLPLFCSVDDFCQTFLPAWKAKQIADPKSRHRARSLPHWQGEFPTLVSYNRFIEYIPSVLVPFFAYLRSLQGPCTGIAFLDSTKRAVWENPRIKQYKVFQNIAKSGKTSTGSQVCERAGSSDSNCTWSSTSKAKSSPSRFRRATSTTPNLCQNC